jgi:hypothetical protein
LGDMAVEEWGCGERFPNEATTGFCGFAMANHGWGMWLLFLFQLSLSL